MHVCICVYIYIYIHISYLQCSYDGCHISQLPRWLAPLMTHVFFSGGVVFSQTPVSQILAWEPNKSSPPWTSGSPLVKENTETHRKPKKHLAAGIGGDGDKFWAADCFRGGGFICNKHYWHVCFHGRCLSLPPPQCMIARTTRQKGLATYMCVCIYIYIYMHICRYSYCIIL